VLTLVVVDRAFDQRARRERIVMDRPLLEAGDAVSIERGRLDRVAHPADAVVIEIRLARIVDVGANVNGIADAIAIAIVDARARYRAVGRCV
jgi:hypothetical protein